MRPCGVSQWCHGYVVASNKAIVLTAEAKIDNNRVNIVAKLLRGIWGEKPQSWEVCSEIAAVFCRQRIRLRSRMSGYQEIRQDRLSRSTFIAIGAKKLSCEERGFFRKWAVPQVDTAQGLAARIIGWKERTNLRKNHGRDEQGRRFRR